MLYKQTMHPWVPMCLSGPSIWSGTLKKGTLRERGNKKSSPNLDYNCPFFSQPGLMSDNDRHDFVLKDKVGGQSQTEKAGFSLWPQMTPGAVF